MTGSYQYTIGQERIADLLDEADRQRLAASGRAQTTRIEPPSPLQRISRRLARLSTT
jgi:hypothetical protein